MTAELCERRMACPSVHSALDALPEVVNGGSYAEHAVISRDMERNQRKSKGLARFCHPVQRCFIWADIR